MQVLITNLLLIVITGGIGYLIAQSHPLWFRFQELGSSYLSGLISVLLLAGAMRAAAVIYGPTAVLSIISVIIGFVLGIWLARRTSNTLR
jgi:hypothetical protein